MKFKLYFLRIGESMSLKIQLKSPLKTTALCFASLLPLMLISANAQASCSLKQSACEASCKVRYLDDALGKMGCMTKCAAERAACSTKEGASEAIEKGKDLVND